MYVTSAFAMVLAVLFPILVIVLIVWWAFWTPFAAADHNKLNSKLGVLMFLCVLGGFVLGSHPLIHPQIARVWAKVPGMNPNDLYPIAAPVRGTDFELADRTVTFKKRPTDTLWAVRVKGKDKFLIPINDTTYTIPTETKPTDVEVYLQSRIDGRSSSPIGVTN